MHQSQSAASLGPILLESAPQSSGYQALLLPPPASHLAFDPEVTGNVASGNQASSDPAVGNQENGSSEGDTSSSSDESKWPVVVVGPNNGIQPITPIEWDGAHPDAVLSQLKALKEALLQVLQNWSMLKPDQQDKALVWFHKLPNHIQCQCL
jgi:hypothetical protein